MHLLHNAACIALGIWLYIGFLGFIWSLCKAAGKPTPKP